jgi:hypothetical protein
VETMGDEGQRRLGGLRPWGRGLASLFVVLAFGVFASVAVAGSGTSASDQYDSAKAIKPSAVAPSTTTTATSSSSVAVAPTNKPAAVASSTTPSSSGVAAAPTKKDLPFTGVSLLTAVVVGGALVGIGFALRRRNERDQS